MNDMKPTDKYKSPAYWTQLIQLMLYDRINEYLKENNLTKKQFAEQIGVSKGYISQILNGDYDHRLSKLTELALSIGLVPKFEFVPEKYAASVARECYLKPKDWKGYNSFAGEFSSDVMCFDSVIVPSSGGSPLNRIA